MSTNLENNVDPQKLREWKEQGLKTQVQIKDNSSHHSVGEVYVRNWTEAERVRRALTWGAIFFGIAVFCVLIPILHFVLVPLFLILMPIMAYNAYKQKSVVLGGFGTCPQCKAPLPIEKSKDSWPLSDLCTGCQNAVKIYLLEN